MNTIPSPARFPIVPATPFIDMVLVASVVALCVIFALMVWSARSTMQRRQRLICPSRHRAARVLFALGPAGNATDVIACSLEPAGVHCPKDCLHPVAQD